MLLEVRKIKLAFGERDLLNIDELILRAGQKIGLVGANGAGKSTLLRVLFGEISPDEGMVLRRADIAYIGQLDGGREDTLDARLSSTFDVKEYHDMLSGGELTRRKIASALEQNAPILLADEPTTNLDITGVRLLEAQLKRFSGAVVLVSHDRALLDAVCTEIAYLENGDLTVFSGNYSTFEKQLAARRARQAAEYDAYRDEQARLSAAMADAAQRRDQVKKTPTRMGNSEARLHKRGYTNAQAKISQTTNALSSRMSQLEVKERPRDMPDIRMKLGNSGGITSKIAVRAQQVNVQVPGRVLIKNADFSLPTGSRTALMGDNGCGKTTLIRRLRDGASGFTVSPGVVFGWFDQDSQNSLQHSQTVLAAVKRLSIKPEEVVRTVLARLNIRGDDVHKKIGNLSGGERAKVQLAQLMVSDVNVLVLDEPTNHLDLFTMTALDTILSEYAGTLIMVSHDRAMIHAVAQRLLIIKDGAIKTYEGTLAQLEESKLANIASVELEREKDILRMRMATLMTRMSQEKRQDILAEINAEYESYAQKLRDYHTKI